MDLSVTITYSFLDLRFLWFLDSGWSWGESRQLSCNNNA